MLLDAAREVDERSALEICRSLLHADATTTYRQARKTAAKLGIVLGRTAFEAVRREIFRTVALPASAPVDATPPKPAPPPAAPARLMPLPTLRPTPAPRHVQLEVPPPAAPVRPRAAARRAREAPMTDALVGDIMTSMQRTARQRTVFRSAIVDMLDVVHGALDPTARAPRRRRPKAPPAV